MKGRGGRRMTDGSPSLAISFCKGQETAVSVYTQKRRSGDEKERDR